MHPSVSNMRAVATAVDGARTLRLGIHNNPTQGGKSSIITILGSPNIEGREVLRRRRSTDYVSSPMEVKYNVQIPV